MQANSQKRRARKTALEFAGYVAPAVFFITLFVGIPFVMCIYYSFRKWNGIGKTSEFIGLENYIRLFTNDPAFVSALKYTFIYAIGTVLIVNVLAIFFAALLESKIKGRGFFRAAFYIPNIISLVIIGFIWKFICTRVFEALMSITGWGIFGLSWLGDSQLAVFSTIIVSVWQSLGFYILIYVAGMQGVPTELNESADLDGAGAVRRFFSITIPLIMPSISFCMLLTIA